MFPLTKNFSVGRQHGLSYKWPILASLPKATSYGVHESSCESSAYLDVLHKFMPTPSCFCFVLLERCPAWRCSVFTYSWFCTHGSLLVGNQIPYGC